MEAQPNLSQKFRFGKPILPQIFRRWLYIIYTEWRRKASSPYSCYLRRPGRQYSFYFHQQDYTWGIRWWDFTCLPVHGSPVIDRFHKFNLKSDKARSGKLSLSLKELNQFTTGDYIVHIDHGVAQFGGLVRTEANGKIQEAIKLVYQNTTSYSSASTRFTSCPSTRARIAGSHPS